MACEDDDLIAKDFFPCIRNIFFAITAVSKMSKPKCKVEHLEEYSV